ncbi:MAG TPA: hypothetical protein VJA21_05235 [Verrucomicrobiae bacterium]
MISNLFKTIGGIENYGLVSLCLFLLIFVCVFVWACVQRKAHLDRIARIPLDPEEPNSGETSHE